MASPRHDQNHAPCEEFVVESFGKLKEKVEDIITSDGDQKINQIAQKAFVDAEKLLSKKAKEKNKS